MQEHERYFFDINGYLAVPGALSAKEVSELNAQIDEHIEHHSDRNAGFLNFKGVLEWGGPMTKLIDHAATLPYLDAMFGPAPWSKPDRGPFYRLDHTYATVIRPDAKEAGAFILHGGGTPFDPGQFYRVNEGTIYNGLVVVAYNLEDVNEGDGGLGVVPGSHKGNFRLPHQWQDLRGNNPIARAVTGPAGTAIFFTEALSHGTLPWKGRRERRTVFFKYNAYCSAFSDKYLDETTPGFEKLTERQKMILEAPSSRVQRRRPSQLQPQ
jgi:hypothetical protein